MSSSCLNHWAILPGCTRAGGGSASPPATVSKAGLRFCCARAAHRYEQALPSVPSLSQGGEMSHAQGKSACQLYGQLGNRVSHETECPGLTWSCQVGFRRRGDQAEDRELPVVPATEDRLHHACAPGGQCRTWKRVTRLQKCPRLVERSGWSLQSISCTSHVSKLWAGMKNVWMLQPPAPTNWEKSKYFCVRNILIPHPELCGNPPEMLWKPSLIHFVCWSHVSSLGKNKAALASSCFPLYPLTFHFPKIKEKKLKTQTASCFWTLCSSRKEQKETTP